MPKPIDITCYSTVERVQGSLRIIWIIFFNGKQECIDGDDLNIVGNKVYFGKYYYSGVKCIRLIGTREMRIPLLKKQCMRIFTFKDRYEIRILPTNFKSMFRFLSNASAKSKENLLRIEVSDHQKQILENVNTIMFLCIRRDAIIGRFNKILVYKEHVFFQSGSFVYSEPGIYSICISFKNIDPPFKTYFQYDKVYQFVLIEDTVSVESADIAHLSKSQQSYIESLIKRMFK